MNEQVSIGIPVPYGYPTAPRPPISATRAAAPPPPAFSLHGGGSGASHSTSSDHQPLSCRVKWAVGASVLIVIIFILMMFVMFFIFEINGYPSFKVEGVTVTVDDNPNNESEYAAAQWNIGLSFSPAGKYHKLNYDDHLDVFLRVTSDDNNWSRTNIVTSSAENMAMNSFNATANTLLHRSLKGFLPLEFQVSIKVDFTGDKTLEANCDNLSVGFSSSSATEGIMEGGPRLCPAYFIPHKR